MRRAVLALTLAACGRLGFDVPSAPDGGGPGDGDVGVPLDHGFFIEVRTPSSEPWSGLAAVDATCLEAVTTRTWLGQAEAIAAGALTAAQVQAWMCVSTGCRDLQPSQRYVYASTLNPTRGGASFIATAAGYLADDDRAYGNDAVFGFDAGFGEYFTGRTQTNLPQAGGTCGDWTSGSLMSNVAVNDTTDYRERLSKYPRLCAERARVICVVAPGPARMRAAPAGGSRRDAPGTPVGTRTSR